MKKYWVILIFTVFGLSFLSAHGQNDTTKQAAPDSVKKNRKFTVNGYLKYLEQLSYTTDITKLQTLDLIHNRLNFRYQPDDHWTFKLELRNRIYYGDEVAQYPGFAALETGGDGSLNLSENWVDRNSMLFNTTIDRANAEYVSGKWDITLGRQRINWGISTVWTPNDIFNSFNYFDFDYEERPGSDAARVQYNLTSTSSLDAAFSPGRTPSQNVGALMYHFNKWGYDFQAFSGVYQQNFTAGGGWAGNIGGAGFKGEVSYFAPSHGMADSASVEASLSLDYSFQNGVYVMISGLYNNLGKGSLLNIAQLTNSTLSARNIFPFRYTMFSQASYSFSPIVKASLGGMFSPSGSSLIVLPSFTYSIADNWQLDLIGQSFYSRQNGSYGPLGNSIFIRLKWGF